jgi:hypothetical protein
MTDRGRPEEPLLPNATRILPSAWEGEGVVPDGPPPFGPRRSMRDAGNLKRVSLPGTESALPAASPDTGGLRSARARKPRTVIFPLSPDPPGGGEPDAPDAWLPADQEVGALDPWSRSDEDAAFPDVADLPERAEQIPWPSEAEMLAEWSQPGADPGQSALPSARSWLAVPFSPVSPHGEAAAHDVRRAGQAPAS